MLYYRVYSRFTLEAIVATAFSRQINLQRGESDEFSKAMDTAMKGFASGQFEYFVLINSTYKWQSQIEGIHCFSQKSCWYALILSLIDIKVSA